MKKIFKYTLIALLVLVVSIFAFVGWYGYKAKTEIKVMTPVETGQVAENVYAVHETFVNTYFIADSGKYIAVDAGNKPEDVKEELAKLNIDPKDVVAVLLTHSDGDHIASVELFKNADIYLSAAEEQMINGETSRFFIVGNSLLVKSYKLIEDQSEFTIGNIKIKGILTPGHTPGAMCYLINDKFLFTGDALSIKDCKIGPFNDFFNMDTEMAMKSLSNIANLPTAEYILTAHYGVCDNYQEAINQLDL